MGRKPKRNLNEEVNALQAFKDGVLELVQKYFGRKPRTTTKGKRNGAARQPQEEMFE